MTLSDNKVLEIARECALFPEVKFKPGGAGSYRHEEPILAFARRIREEALEEALERAEKVLNKFPSGI